MSDPASETHRAALRGLLGSDHVITGDAAQAYEVDWRGKYTGSCLAVVRPADTRQVSGVLRYCAASGIAVVPQGGNTGFVGGATPDGSGRQVILSTQRLKRVRHVGKAGATMVVEAGCELARVRAAAAEHGMSFPLSMGSEGSATIGGNLATNAGGTQVVRYGTARQLCLGIEVVLPNGDVLDALRQLPKDNTGYALRDLFIGSEGTLGVITAACLRLYPAARGRAAAWVALPSIEAAVELFKRARELCDASLTGFELMNAVSVEWVRTYIADLPVPRLDGAEYAGLIQLDDPTSDEWPARRLEALLEQSVADDVVADAVVAQSLHQVGQFWKMREAIPLAQAREGPNVKHDISLPIEAIPAFLRMVEPAIARDFPGARIVNFGHLGDGNLHFNVAAPTGIDAKAFCRDHELPINELVFGIVDRHGGSISAEHGIGQARVDALPGHRGSVAVDLMRAIKNTVDPTHIMNPGKVLASRSDLG